MDLVLNRSSHWINAVGFLERNLSKTDDVSHVKLYKIHNSAISMLKGYSIFNWAISIPNSETH